MRLLFLIPLTTGIFFSYLAYQASEDITYLASILAAFSVLLSLILAPWQLQLLLLLLILLSATQFGKRLGNKQQEETSQQSANSSNSKIQTPENTINAPIEAENPSMLRKYRGVTYKLEVKANSNQSDEQELEDQYGGVSVKMKNGQQAPIPSPKFELKYRGASVISDKNN